MDLLVVTHDHWDRVSGFVQARVDGIFGSFIKPCRITALRCQGSTHGRKHQEWTE